MGGLFEVVSLIIFFGFPGGLLEGSYVKGGGVVLIFRV